MNNVIGMPEQESNVPAIGSGPTDFTVHQLTVFRTVAHHLSYTRAAEDLYLSQPAVSQQVRNLELVLGLRLFARSGRGIVLTPAGQELLRHAERLLALQKPASADSPTRPNSIAGGRTQPQLGISRTRLESASSRCCRR